ncbi:phosphate ABC transporter, permease protein PstA, partial [Micrococcus sp. SIMBA_144]
PPATEDSVTPRRHHLTAGQTPGWTWMAVAAAAAAVAAGLTVLLSGLFNAVRIVLIAAILYTAGLYVAIRLTQHKLHT